MQRRWQTDRPFSLSPNGDAFMQDALMFARCLIVTRQMMEGSEDMKADLKRRYRVVVCRCSISRRSRMSGERLAAGSRCKAGKAYED
jgi:hypothetical protein